MVKIALLPTIFRRKEVRDKLEKVCRDHDVLFLALFGSFANGRSASKSDVDLLVKFNNAGDKSYLDLISTERAMAGVFKRKVDLVTADGLSPYLRKDVLRNMCAIYER